MQLCITVHGKILAVKIGPNTWVGGKGSCAVCVDLQAVGVLDLEFFGELYSLAKGFDLFLRRVWASNCQHFTGICRVACPLIS